MKPAAAITAPATGMDIKHHLSNAAQRKTITFTPDKTRKSIVPRLITIMLVFQIRLRGHSRSTEITAVVSS